MSFPVEVLVEDRFEDVSMESISAVSRIAEGIEGRKKARAAGSEDAKGSKRGKRLIHVCCDGRRVFARGSSNIMGKQHVVIRRF